MIRKLWVAMMLISSCGLASCSTQEDEQFLPTEDEQPWSRIDKVTVVADDILATTRTAFTLDGNKLAFSWAEGDKIGIFPITSEGNSQVSLSISAGAGQNTATFTGGGWALRSDISYVAYYPYDVNGTNKEILLNYEGQKQTGNASLAHLGTHDFMATQPVASVDNALTLQFSHLNSFAQLNLQVPVAATFTSLTIWSLDKIFARTAKLNLSGSSYEYTQQEMSNRLEMELSDVASTAENQVLTFYMNLFPTDMTGHIVYVTLQSSDKKVYEAILNSKTLVAGKAYKLDATLTNVTVETTVTSPSFSNNNL